MGMSYLYRFFVVVLVVVVILVVVILVVVLLLLLLFFLFLLFLLLFLSFLLLLLFLCCSCCSCCCSSCSCCSCCSSSCSCCCSSVLVLVVFLLSHFHTAKYEKEWGEIQESEEMDPKWIDLKDIPYKSMWSDDEIWLPKMLKEEEIWFRFWINSESSHITRFQQSL